MRRISASISATAVMTADRAAIKPCMAAERPATPSLALRAWLTKAAVSARGSRIPMVEDIITGLSRIRWLFVIARNSSFTHKGRAVDIRQVGRELGVRYVLEGDARKAGARLRITAQLLEAETGAS